MRNTSKITALFASLSMMLLILDGKTALSGATAGMTVAIETVIPSLFPFFFLSTLLTGSFYKDNFPFLHQIRKLLHMPVGTEGVLIAGILGGYPAGAQAVASLYHSRVISRENAEKLLAFCNNPGPAFLFGMVASFFPSLSFSWCLWGIILLGAFFTAMLFPCTEEAPVLRETKPVISSTAALKSTLHITACVCGWVILFRVLIAFAQRWFLWILPKEAQTAVIGALELSNGCCFLSAIQDIRIRFLLCCGMLSCGGLCVAMQTASAANGLSLRSYFFGKLIHTSFCLSFAAGIQYGLWIPSAMFFVIYFFLLAKVKKSSSFPALSGV